MNELKWLLWANEGADSMQPRKLADTKHEKLSSRWGGIVHSDFWILFLHTPARIDEQLHGELDLLLQKTTFKYP